MRLSSFFNGTELIRDAEVKLTHYADQSIDGIVCFALNESFIKKANQNEHVKAIITSEAMAHLVDKSKGLVLSSHPKKTYYELHNYMYTNGYMELIAKPSIDSSASIAKSAIIDEHVIIEEGVIIDEYAVVKSNSIIRAHTYIGPHAVIGARGMHNTKIDGHFMHVYDAGGVEIGRGCEVLAGAIIQKSYHKEMTTIGDETKVSVKVNIAHGVVVGQRTLIAGNCQIAGYTTIGNDVWIGPSSVISHSLKILDNAEIKLGSVVVRNVKENAVVSGNFAYDHNKHLKNHMKAQR